MQIPNQSTIFHAVAEHVKDFYYRAELPSLWFCISTSLMLGSLPLLFIRCIENYGYKGEIWTRVRENKYLKFFGLDHYLPYYFIQILMISLVVFSEEDVTLRNQTKNCSVAYLILWHLVERLALWPKAIRRNSLKFNIMFKTT